MRVDRIRAALGLAVLVACSSPATPPAATVAAQVAEKPDSAEPDVPVDLSPVAAPENLVVLGTFRSPARTLDTLMGWSGLELDWRALLQAGPAAQFMPVIDLDAPIDAAATLDPKSKNKPRVLFAASVGLTSRQGALDAFRGIDVPVDMVEPGVYAVQPNPRTLCFIAPALGKAKVRLVCGEDRESVEQLTPYLTRGNPSASTGDSALHVELRAEPPWRLYGDKAQFLKLSIPMLLGEVSIGNQEFDGALRELLTASVEELTLTLAELKDLRLDLRLQEEPAELALVTSTELRGSTSWLAGVLSSAEARASTAPETFWKLPLDAYQASYQARTNPESMQRAYDLLERVSQAGLSQLGASPAVQREWPQAVREAFSGAGAVVSARGDVPARLLGATTNERDQLRASFGYWLLGIEDENKRYPTLLERTLRTYEDAALRKGLAQRYGLNAAQLPKVQSKKGPARLAESHVYEVNLPAHVFAVLAGGGLKGNDQLTGTIPLVIFSCREGTRTWIGLSSYAAAVEERLTAVLASSGPEATLARRSGLDSLRTQRSNVAGFWTLSGMQRSTGRAELRKLLSALGTSDIPLLFRANGHTAGPSGDVELHVPAQVFRDLAAAYQSKAQAQR